MNEKKLVSCPNCGKKIRIPKGKHITFKCPHCETKLEFDYNKTSNFSDEESESNFGDTIISILSYLIAIPLFILLHRLLPELNWKFHFDRLLLFFATIGIVRLFFRIFKVTILTSFLILIIFLSYGSFSGKYGFTNLANDYKHMLYSIKNNPHPEEIIISDLKQFPHKSDILNAIDYKNPNVRDFAVSATRKHFMEYSQDNDYRNLVQYFAVFKEINENWNYVNDPKGNEYFAKASETVKHLSGDCDDHSILMAACIKAIGGTTRLIATKGHLYPELMIGSKSDLEAANYLIKKELFASEIGNNNLSYHIDENGQIWLNLDYTAKYPGGKFMSEEILGVLNVDN